MAVARTYLDAATDGDTKTIYTFSSLSFGTEAADRLLLAGVSGRAFTAGRTIASVTIGGVSATLYAISTFGASDTTVSAFALASVPSGTSGSVVVTYSDSIRRSAVSLWSITGAGDTPTDSDNPTVVSGSVITGTLDVPDGGAVFANVLAVLDRTATWTGVDGDFNQSVGGISRNQGASRLFAAASAGHTVQATITGGDSGLVMACLAFGPSGSSGSVGLIGRGLVGNNPLISIGRGGLIS